MQSVPQVLLYHYKAKIYITFILFFNIFIIILFLLVITHYLLQKE